MPLANVIGTRTGTGWTIDVTAAQLSPNITEKDFTVLHNGVGTPNVNYVKTTAAVLTYVGTAVPSNTTIEIRRKTSFDNTIYNITYANRFSSSTWNNALQRISRWEEEVDLNGAGAIGAGVIPLPANDAYGAVWTNDTIYSPTRKALWDKFEVMAPLDSPTFIGAPRAVSLGAIQGNSKILTHSDAQAALALKADLISPTFTGNPLAPTPVHTDNTTKIATTAHVKSVLTNSPSITTPAITGGGSVAGVLTVPTSSPSYDLLSTAQVLSHVDARNVLDNRFIVSVQQSGVQAVTSGIYAAITYNVSNRNIGGHMNLGTGVFTVPKTGWYMFHAYTSATASGGTPPTSMRFLIDFAGIRLQDINYPGAIVADTSYACLALSVGQLVYLNGLVFTTGGSGFTLGIGGSGQNRLDIFYISA